MKQRLLRAYEVCEILGGISRQTLRRWRRDQGFPEPIRINSATNYWLEDEVNEWIESRRSTEKR